MGAWLAKKERLDFHSLRKKLFSAEFLFYLLLAFIVSLVFYITFLSKIGFAEKTSDYLNILWKTRELWSTPIPSLLDEALWERGNVQEIFETALFHLPYLLYFTALTHSALRWRWRLWETRDLLVIITALFGIGAYGLILFRAGFDAMFRVLPPFYLLMAYYHYRVGQSVTAWIRQLPDLSHLSKKLIWVGRALLLSVFFGYFLFDVTWNNGFYVGSIGAMRECRAPLEMERAHLMVPENEHRMVTKITQVVKESTKPEDPIFALPFNPIWYFLTERKNSFYYEWILPGVLKDKKSQENFVLQLMAKPPKMIIYADIPIDGREERRVSNYAYIVDWFIRTNYVLKKKVSYFEILEWKGKN